MIKKAVLFTLATVLCAGIASITRAQEIAANTNPATTTSDEKKSDGPATKADASRKSGSTLEEQLTALAEKMNKLESIIEEQQKKIDELQRQRNSETATAMNSTAALPGAEPASGGMRRKPADDESPLTFHIGTATITPVGQLDFTTIFRTTNVGNANATPFGAVPFNNQIAGHLTETRLSGASSRFGFRVDAKVHDWDVIGMLEADFFGNNPANLNITSNSYTNRLRQAWFDARRGKFEVLGGQSWSLLTPNRKGLSPLNEDVSVTRSVDLNYHAGLIWARQAQLRLVYHPNDKVAAGVSIENPEQFVGAGEVVFPFAFNAQLGVQFDAANNPATPNLHPDIIGKIAFDPDAGGRHFHIEAAGFLRSFKTATFPIGGSSFAGHTTTGAGGSVNFDLEVLKNIHFISDNFFSRGGGRYAIGLGPDVVVLPNADGTDINISKVTSYATIQGVEAKAWKKWLLFGYYGGAYFRRNFAIDTTNPLPGRFAGFGAPNSPNSANRSVQEATGGFTYTAWSDPKYGAIQWTTQASYVTRSPWFVAAGAPKNAHTAMVFLSLRYVLPGKAPKK